MAFKFHYPARGRKHFSLPELPLSIQTVQIPLPRKGTETTTARQKQEKILYGSNSITPQGDGNWLNLANRSFLAEGSNSITPQGDGNPPIWLGPLSPFWFKFHYPARGRKHVCCYLLMLKVTTVQIPLPRKGTETPVYVSVNIIQKLCSNSITPQGDGNKTVSSLINFMSIVQIPLPRKGTETLHFIAAVSCDRNLVQIPLPRKGTETLKKSYHLDRLLVQIPLPRKGTETVVFCGRIGCFFVQIPLPRKGTETGFTGSGFETVAGGSNSITPQGDGNLSCLLGLVCGSVSVQIPLPRKGTETLRGSDRTISSPCSNSITPQGDGNQIT